MAAIDAERVRRIAKLARLNLADEEVPRLARHLGEIVQYFDQLAEVDTTGVEPLAHPLPVCDVTRDDEPGDTLPADAALQNAPQRIEDFFKVPKVLDQGSGA